MRYLLLNKDTPVCEFTIINNRVCDNLVLQSKQMPYGYSSIGEWIENRIASKHNKHLQRLMRDLHCDTKEGFIRVTHATGINDTYWIRAVDEEINWADVSLYQNPFNKTISRLAFEGLGLYDTVLSTTSPELSTDGSFKKCWRIENTTKSGNQIFLYKRGTENYANAGLEPYCEVLTSEIASRFIKDAVKYRLCTLHGKIASRCKLFTSEEFGYVPNKQILKAASLEETLQFYESIGSEDLFRRMVILDGITFNTDRHSGNYGVLINNATQDIVRMAPVFDFNLALLPYVTMDEFLDIGRKLDDYAPKLGTDFTKDARLLMTDSIRRDLSELKDFTFTSFTGDDVFSKERVQYLESMVQKQVRAVLSKEVLYTKDVFVSDYIQKREKRALQIENLIKAVNEIQGFDFAYELDDIVWCPIAGDTMDEFAIGLDIEKETCVFTKNDVLVFKDVLFLECEKAEALYKKVQRIFSQEKEIEPPVEIIEQC